MLETTTKMNLKECKYKEKCRGYPSKCIDCQNSPNFKADYYEPDIKRPRIWTTDPNTNPFYKVTIADGSQPCLAERCAENIRRQNGLPPGTPVPVLISCPCPKCTPRF